MAACTVVNVDGIGDFPLLGVLHGQAGSFSFSEGRGGKGSGEVNLVRRPLFSSQSPKHPIGHQREWLVSLCNLSFMSPGHSDPLLPFPRCPPPSKMVFMIQIGSFFSLNRILFLLPTKNKKIINCA